MGHDVRTRGGGACGNLISGFFFNLFLGVEKIASERLNGRIIRHDVALLASLITTSSGAVRLQGKIFGFKY